MRDDFWTQELLLEDSLKSWATLLRVAGQATITCKGCRESVTVPDPGARALIITEFGHENWCPYLLSHGRMARAQ